jgi:membrane associated rhomboid family serine protease
MVIPLGELRRTRVVPVVTYLLIAINVTVFLVQQQRGEEFTRAFAMTPREVTQNEDLEGQVPRRIPTLVRDAFGRVQLEMRQEDLEHHRCPIPVRWTLLTSMFLHGSWIHLLGNMLYLWVFGDDVEEVLGPFRYIIVYLACGLMGWLAQIAANPQSDVPTLGASGAIAGIMAAYVVWYPHNPIRVLLVLYITVMPASLVIAAWVFLQIWMGAGAFHRGGDEGGVAYLAHVGGAVTGLFVGFLFAEQARYLKERNAAAQGWTAYEDPESP